MSNKTKTPETPETPVSRATRTTEQVLKQQNADAERDRAQAPATTTTPPAAENGFEGAPDGTRLVQGPVLRCVDGKWSTRDDSPLPPALLALSTARALQRWQGGKVETIVKEIGKELPDPKELNAAIPESTWEKGHRRKAAAAVAETVCRVLAQPYRRRDLYLHQQHGGGAHRGGAAGGQGADDAHAPRRQRVADGEARQRAAANAVRRQTAAGIRDRTRGAKSAAPGSKQELRWLEDQGNQVRKYAR